MHIVFLVTFFPVRGYNTSGVAHYAANISKTLVEYGHSVTIISEADTEEAFEWNGVEVHYIKAGRGFKNTGKKMPVYQKFLKNILRSFWYNLEVYKVNKRKKIDIVQSINTYGIPLFRLKKIPYVIRMSGYSPLWGGAMQEKFDYNTYYNSHRIDEEMQLWAIKKANGLYAPSKLIRDIIFEKTGVNGEVIEGPVVIYEVNQNVLDEFKLQEGRYWITYGELGHRKSIKIWGEIINSLCEKYSSMKYVIVGRDKMIPIEGKYVMATEYLLKQIDKKYIERVVLTGEIVDRKKMFSLIKYSFCCILPTRIDNLPNTVMEAMSLGKIVISNDTTSVEQLIKSGVNGFLAKVDSPEDMIEKATQFMNKSDEEKRIMSEKALERAKNFAPEKTYEKLISLYNRIINENNSQVNCTTDSGQ